MSRTRITSVDFFEAQSPLSQPIADATHQIPAINFVIARVTLAGATAVAVVELHVRDVAGRQMAGQHLMHRLGFGLCGSAEVQHGAQCRIADALEDRGYVLVLTRLRPDDPARLETFVESGRIDALIVLTPTRTWPAGGTTPVVNWDGTDDAGALVDNVLRRVSGEAA